jgi:hypothetical protein
VYYTKTQAVFCLWPKNTKLFSSSLNIKEGTTYLQALLICPKDFAEFLSHTKFYSQHCMSQNANDQGRFVIIKTRLTTKGREECKGREDYIYVARG